MEQQIEKLKEENRKLKQKVDFLINKKKQKIDNEYHIKRLILKSLFEDDLR